MPVNLESSWEEILPKAKERIPERLENWRAWLGLCRANDGEQAETLGGAAIRAVKIILAALLCSCMEQVSQPVAVRIRIDTTRVDSCKPPICFPDLKPPGHP